MNPHLKNSFMYWLPMPVIGILNGTFRQTILVQDFDERLARQISTLILIIILAIYIRAIYKKLLIESINDAWQTGLMWVALTLGFEFALGYFVSHYSLQAMLAEYNLMEGKLWVLVPLNLLLIPVLFFEREKKT